MRHERRRFVRGVAGAVGLSAASAAPYALSRLLAPAEAHERHRALLPPGAIGGQQAFEAACIGCGLCGEVCPPRCIRFRARAGGGGVNTPYIDPEQRGCILCGKCMDACPTDALTPRSRESIDMGVAQIDRSACYPWVDRGVCGACVTVCPLGEHAIGFDFANLYRPIVKTGCVGCGLCVEVCPEPSLPIRIARRTEGRVARHTRV